jgi:hypothetical protein
MDVKSEADSKSKTEQDATSSTQNMTNSYKGIKLGWYPNLNESDKGALAVRGEFIFSFWRPNFFGFVNCDYYIKLPSTMLSDAFLILFQGGSAYGFSLSTSSEVQAGLGFRVLYMSAKGTNYSGVNYSVKNIGYDLVPRASFVYHATKSLALAADLMYVINIKTSIEATLDGQTTSEDSSSSENTLSPSLNIIYKF